MNFIMKTALAKFHKSGWHITDHDQNQELVCVFNDKSEEFFKIIRKNGMIVFFKQIKINLSVKTNTAKIKECLNKINANMLDNASTYLSDYDKDGISITIRTAYPFLLNEDDIHICIQQWITDLNTAIKEINKKLRGVIGDVPK